MPAPAPAHSCYTSLSVGADIISSVIHLNEDSHGKVKTIKAFATMRCIPMTWIIQDKDRRVKWLNRAKWSQHNTRQKRSSWSPARRCSGRRRCGRGRGWSCSCQQRAAALPGVPTHCQHCHHCHLRFTWHRSILPWPTQVFISDLQTRHQDYQLSASITSKHEILIKCNNWKIKWYNYTI